VPTRQNAAKCCKPFLQRHLLHRLACRASVGNLVGVELTDMRVGLVDTPAAVH